MSYQIGTLTGNSVEWESHSIGEDEIHEALMSKLGIEDGLARGSMAEAGKMGDRGVHVSNTHKIRRTA